jgi:hypothetical protein
MGVSSRPHRRIIIDMRQPSLFTRSQLAEMRDRTAARNYSPAADEFRRDHERRRAYGLARRHAQRLRHARCRRADASDTDTPTPSNTPPDSPAAGGGASPEGAADCGAAAQRHAPRSGAAQTPAPRSDAAQTHTPHSDAAQTHTPHRAATQTHMPRPDAASNQSTPAPAMAQPRESPSNPEQSPPPSRAEAQPPPSAPSGRGSHGATVRNTSPPSQRSALKNGSQRKVKRIPETE